ncbi:DNA (cytosine-5-)-methyltransferase [Acinetobacter haemolyticus]|jgi:DNA (cytosine-5)-methyltransferase 1|uniref:DNA cytosine methyltransferase n=1 Tax=Acinetobacter TaxID=469 RepID=UPI0010AAF2E5|nr:MULTISPECIES: DNA cytosine methyltransferase [Acinetobacter]MCU4408635.1 DNA cytosine methyltransferase [Acinetobacter junii]MEB8379557.1 DNA cytosine methyltransferase [Acinetobacter junii]NAS04943.1 DNA (cytosine-5-)-methyltransferase [Acinetobacter haemolyticus]TID67116.1 DNA (cytosine-5-)-methyltransferase [Acinetobacter junii]
MLNDVNNQKLTYIDLFSGCGGLSLGLGKAGWQGILAVEKDPMAFATFEHNLIDSENSHFYWPTWLPKKETTIQELITTYSEELKSLKGKVDLIAGGPPCQGFSLAGQRNENDPRNKLSEEYIKMVKVISPKYLLLENVRGFNSSFKNKENGKVKKPYSLIVKAKLEKLGYKVFHNFVCSADFGVPQKRTRFIMIGIRKELLSSQEDFDPFYKLIESREHFLSSKKLPLRYITTEEAIGDLLIKNNGVKYHSGNELNGFKQIDYKPSLIPTAYQDVMREGTNGLIPNSLRIARHKESTIEKFKKIQKICKPGISLNDEMRAHIGTRKQAITVLDASQPSRTLTTLPDDLLHYSEPRILTVREMARIQSFPDSFRILGKYTTGGDRRTSECPRYTQIGNAVPPFLAEALGLLIKSIEDNYAN